MTNIQTQTRTTGQSYIVVNYSNNIIIHSTSATLSVQLSFDGGSTFMDLDGTITSGQCRKIDYAFQPSDIIKCSGGNWTVYERT